VPYSRDVGGKEGSCSRHGGVNVRGQISFASGLRVEPAGGGGGEGKEDGSLLHTRISKPSKKKGKGYISEKTCSGRHIKGGLGNKQQGGAQCWGIKTGLTRPNREPSKKARHWISCYRGEQL